MVSSGLASTFAPGAPAVVPADAARHPINTDGHAVFSEFFPMVDAPFEYGGAWTADDDEHRAPAGGPQPLERAARAVEAGDWQPAEMHFGDMPARFGYVLRPAPPA